MLGSFIRRGVRCEEYTRFFGVLVLVVSSLAVGMWEAARPAYAASWVVNMLSDTTNGSCTTTCTLRDAMTLAARDGYKGHQRSFIACSGRSPIHVIKSSQNRKNANRLRGIQC
jgi:CSLREA domain-containing protein